MPLSMRVDELEKSGRRARLRIVHVMPRQTTAQALAAHRRKHGKIPPRATVVFIQHTFRSAI